MSTAYFLKVNTMKCRGRDVNPGTIRRIICLHNPITASPPYFWEYIFIGEGYYKEMIFMKSTIPSLKSIFILVLIFIFFTTTVQSNCSDPMLQGTIIIAPLSQRTTYMINENGHILQTWESDYRPGLSVYSCEDGSIYRAYCTPLSLFGGGVQKIDNNNNVVWDFNYWNDTVKAHHDIEPLPNGNVLMIAWETKTRDDAIEQGRNPNTVGDEIYPVKIIEVKPTGPTTGEIVWEWHVWDHLIQDYDSSKANYGIIRDHPELIDINYGSTSGDWLHTNSIDYNEQFDQILLSSHNFNEIWIIDHSTTITEAAGHTGGNSGNGGDLLYRWGNPEAYERGTIEDKVFSLQHYAKWVTPGYPGSGNILVFNNGVAWLQSSVDEFTPPILPDGSYYMSGYQPYGPSSLAWSYTRAGSFFSAHLSGAERLPNGNTLILDGETGYYFIVTPDGAIVWDYDAGAQVFAPCFVPTSSPPTNPNLDTDGILNWNSIKPGTTVIGSFNVTNIGTGRVSWTINSPISWGNWSFNPPSGSNYNNTITTVNVMLVVPNEENSNFEEYILVQNIYNQSDFDLVPVTLTTVVSSIQEKNFYPFLRGSTSLVTIKEHLLDFLSTDVS